MWNGSRNPKKLPVDVTEAEFADLTSQKRELGKMIKIVGMKFIVIIVGRHADKVSL